MIVNRTELVRIMREEYDRHLRKLIFELDVFDSRGELLIGPDLKVVHEPSGYEYTVATVEGPEGDAKVTLRSPESPRPSATGMKASDEIDSFDEADTDPEDDGGSKKDLGKSAYPHPADPPSEETVFVVDQSEFEKHYKEA